MPDFESISARVTSGDGRLWVELKPYQAGLVRH